MEFDKIVETRHSVRAFRHDSISIDTVNEILRTANRAPSAGNLQAYEIYIVEERKTKEELSEAANGQDFIADAPVLLVFCANSERSAAEYGKRGSQLYSIQDATIAATFAILKAVDVGLSTTWVGSFDEIAVAKAIGSGMQRPVAIIAIGHPNEEPEITERRELSDLVHYVSH